MKLDRFKIAKKCIFEAKLQHHDCNRKRDSIRTVF
jgi:hypothetical protein